MPSFLSILCALLFSTASMSAVSISVHELGATGDGQTDDTAAIQRAVAALPIRGGTIVFPCGTYVISSGILISSSNTTVTAAPNCATLKSAGTNSFVVLKFLGKGLGPAERLVRDTTDNTFTLGHGGLTTLGIVPGSYVVVSDTPVASNGANSPLISTQQVVKVTSVAGDTATIEGNFAHDFTVASPYAANQGCCPYAQRIIAPLSNVQVTFLRFDGASNRGSNARAVEMDFAVNSEIGHVQISNFLQTPGPTDAIRVDTGYMNNIHDIICTRCGNGGGHSLWVLRQSAATINSISITNTATQQVFGFNAGSMNNSVVSNLIVDAGGADGRPFKLLRANHNHFDHVTAKNSGNGKNGINITDISTYNTFDDCVAVANNGTGIMMFGNFNVHNTFNNCTAEYNTLSQFGQGKDSFGNYGDHFTSIKGGTYCYARGHSNIIQINSNDFTLRDALIRDDNGKAPYGLVIAGASSTVENNRFAGFAKGRDTLLPEKK